MANLPLQSQLPDGAARCGQHQPHTPCNHLVRGLQCTLENGIWSFLWLLVMAPAANVMYRGVDSSLPEGRVDSSSTRWDEFSWGNNSRISAFTCTLSKTIVQKKMDTELMLSIMGCHAPWKLFSLVEENSHYLRWKATLVVNVSSLWDFAGIQDRLHLQEPHCPWEAPLQERRGNSCHSVSCDTGGQWTGTAEPL